MYQEKIDLENIFLKNNELPYIGSKKENLQHFDKVINKLIKNNENLLKKETISFVDLFSGSGVVSRYAKLKGFKVIANDLEIYSKIMTEVPIRYYKEQVEHYFEFVYQKLSLQNNDFSSVNSDNILIENSYYLTVLNYINSLKKVKYSKNKYFSIHFSPQDTFSAKKTEKLYYTKENAEKIDAIIELIFNNKIFSREPRDIILASLMIAMLEVVNNENQTTRNYQTVIAKGNKEIKKRVLSELTLNPIVFLEKQNKIFQDNKKLLTAENLCEVHSAYAESLLEIKYPDQKFDFVYLDPPYNSQQYSQNYSHLTSVSLNDKQKITDENKKFESRNDLNQSSFCRKMKNRGKKMAELALLKTFNSIKANYIIYSYTTNTILTIPEIFNIFSDNGNNYISVEYEAKNDLEHEYLNKNNTINHCLFVIQKNKRQYQEEIDFIIRDLKAKAIIPENETFQINQKFINYKKLIFDNPTWKIHKNSITKKHKLFNKNKFMFEINTNLMILSNIDTDFNEDEKNLISQYLISENEVEEVKKSIISEEKLPTYIQQINHKKEIKEEVLPTFEINESKKINNFLEKNNNELPNYKNHEIIRQEKEKNIDELPTYKQSEVSKNVEDLFSILEKKINKNNQ